MSSPSASTAWSRASGTPVASASSSMVTMSSGTGRIETAGRSSGPGGPVPVPVRASSPMRASSAASSSPDTRRPMVASVKPRCSEAADALQPGQVLVVVPGHPALAARRIEQALALVVADGVHRQVGTGRQLFDPHLHDSHSRSDRSYCSSAGRLGPSRPLDPAASVEVAVDHLGHTAGLGRPLGLEGQVEGHLHAAGDVLGRRPRSPPDAGCCPPGPGPESGPCCSRS